VKTRLGTSGVEQAAEQEVPMSTTPSSDQYTHPHSCSHRVALLRLHLADADDARQIALLHADSWRRYYRGAYADSFLDGDVDADRRSVWSARLATPTNSHTVVAEHETRLVGFVHVLFDHDQRWGSLVDNLHVAHDHHRIGVGTALLAHAARAVVKHAPGDGMYLWVLEKNTPAQEFYRACGARRRPVPAQRHPTQAPHGLGERHGPERA
jgi:GNAT superfamily N-acetyltransferase